MIGMRRNVTLLDFVAALVLLGLGWNFLFIGATILLTDTYSGLEKATAQGLNDFLVFGMVAVTAFSSGALHHAYGWAVLNMAMTRSSSQRLPVDCGSSAGQLVNNAPGCRLSQGAGW
jgi:hypothetical protein